MPKGHFSSAGASIDYGDTDMLSSVDDIDATVLRYRDAQLALDDVDSADVIVVSPTGRSSSIILTQCPLTAIRIESLPTAIRTQLDEKITAPIDSFELIQIGKWTTDSQNHSLSEFAGD